MKKITIFVKNFTITCEKNHKLYEQLLMQYVKKFTIFVKKITITCEEIHKDCEIFTNVNENVYHFHL